jgi:hypothetical protein
MSIAIPVILPVGSDKSAVSRSPGCEPQSSIVPCVGLKIVIFGATGMIGHGVLREALLSPAVDEVLTVGRRPAAASDPKLRQVTVSDLADLGAVEVDLTGADACFFCLGVSSAGMSEADYTRVTYDYTVSAASTLARLNPGMTFVFVSGAGTDSSESGRVMWARVKGRAENAVLALPLDAYMFRPGFIQPRHGATSRTRLYRAIYAVITPLYPVLKRLMPGSVTTTEHIGRAMVAIAIESNARPVRAGDATPNRILDSAAINEMSET